MKAVLKLLSWAVVVGLAGTMGYLCNLTASAREVEWVRSIYQQKLAIASHIHANQRVILVGGSSTHFGVDAAQLEQQLGVPAVNFGLHAGLGLDTTVGIVADVIQPGDTIVLLPEYRLLESATGENTIRLSSLFGIMTGHPLVGESEPKQMIEELIAPSSVDLSSIPAVLAGVLPRSNSAREPQKGYSDRLSQRGDSVNLPSGKLTPGDLEGYISPYALKRLTRFRQQVEQAGGKLVIGLPWVWITPEQTKVRPEIQKTVIMLRSLAPVLYNPKDLNLKTDATLFGDTHYHLSARGRSMRTQELAEQLRPLLLP